ncbi:MAG: hypothetical protein E6Q97_07830 [Desulfurellales bacterium]|nr:MAG: hypothetical protein E6Q97_07830 [Desulfurellales bacterium]
MQVFNFIVGMVGFGFGFAFMIVACDAEQWKRVVVLWACAASAVGLVFSVVVVVLSFLDGVCIRGVP